MSLKIVFAGTPEFGLPSLEALKNSHHQLQAVFTQPDKPAGRGRKVQQSAVKKWALVHNVPVYQPGNFKDENALQALAVLKADIFVVIAYGLILPKNILSLPRLGCINVHASLLPRWRGASPIQQAILEGDNYTGITIMQMDAGMDTGDKLAEARCPIYQTDTAGILHNRLAQLAVEPLLITLDALVHSKGVSVAQDNTQASFAKKIAKTDAMIDWNKGAQEINNQIRAFNPWPIAYTQAGENCLRIYQARVVEMDSTASPGTILGIYTDGIIVATGKAALKIEVLQFPGTKTMVVSDWLNGRPTQLKVGLVLQ